MKEAIFERAKILGFDDCRVTDAQPPETGRMFERWLEEHRHGEMAYLLRNAHKRVDPQKVLNGARSILTLAVSYSSISDSQPSTGKPETTLRTAGAKDLFSGTIARYARYQDYHEVIGTRLRELAEFIDKLGNPGTRSLWYIDTGPLLERDLAQRAGLGFIGKHTNLISRKLGNYFFLGEILTTLELSPDNPESNRCGSCTRCINACPTGAIPMPFQLDARRCISYLTIELKGSIPVKLRPLIGNRIYGCDDCLEVCPWNRFAREGKMMKAHARPDLTTADLLELIAIDEETFARRFTHTPMARTRRRGLVRNCCVALGNVGDARALPALAKAAADPEPVIAEHAQWAIDQIQSRLEGKSDRDFHE
jgi:epoxyqueuosine reductase